MLLGARFFVLAGAGAHVLCHGASFLGMPLAKARFEGIAKVKNNFTRLKPPNTAACNFYNADKGNSEGKVGTHMDVAKNALRIRGFAAAGISVACMLAAACLAAGVPCNQVAYASETES